MTNDPPATTTPPATDKEAASGAAETADPKAAPAAETKAAPPAKAPAATTKAATPQPAAAPPSPKKTASAPSSPSFLPTVKVPAKTDFADLIVTLYGTPKIGKSTFASKFPGAVFLPTEPGLSHLEVYQAPPDGSGIRTWDQFTAIFLELRDRPHPFKTVVVDTVDNLYKLCAEKTLGEWGIRHLDDLDSKKGYTLCNSRFERAIRALAQLPTGLVLISHEVDREVKDRAGMKYTKATTTLPSTANKIVVGLSDLILRATIVAVREGEGEEAKIVHRRVLLTKPNVAYDAGDRTGALPPEVPLDFPALETAFRAGMERRRKGGA